jgi:hypothetical protein
MGRKSLPRPITAHPAAVMRTSKKIIVNKKCLINIFSFFQVLLLALGRNEMIAFRH